MNASTISARSTEGFLGVSLRKTRGRQMIGKVFLGLAFAIAMANAGLAQDTSARDEVLDFAEKPVSEDFRPRFIGTLAKYCQDVLNALPTNTPAEDAWIAWEEKTKDREKLQRLFDSKEYSRSILRNTFSECKDTTKLLFDIKQMRERAERLRLESSLFIKLALNFNVSLERYSSKVELSENVKAKMGEAYFQVVRQGSLKAAVKTLYSPGADHFGKIQ
jgi:hypothetical protein